MARPKKSKEDKRIEYIKIYLSAKEKAEIKNNFYPLNDDLSSTVREVLLNGHYSISYRDRTKEEMILSLGRIGTNLNQHIKQIHQYPDQKMFIETAKIISKLEKEIESITETLVK
ncbi:hypothetical protein L3049_10745 [Labilibaculum sp. DW002]|uniref:Mobilization protein n=1 Tax=Paralabilibaculum antarcticum TaxID=2912572 RepID=A0ABT5VT56_9BACT|nr:hypothetical protein [Labilibaculum sp. DW002]MDE5418487.1 hypothetical protein [Labilibaculum sp. DW002]